MKLNKRIVGIIAFLFTFCSNAFSQQYYQGGVWGDNGDGTFNNPVLPADYRDPDIIRVGSDYYMITSTFWMSPGITILHSKDLVNWSYFSAAVPDITKINKLYTWYNITYPGGIWAPCISYNKKTKLYYIHWGDNALGFFVVTASSIKGPWSDPKEVTFQGKPIGPRHDDCGVLWEEDGNGYMVYNEIGFDRQFNNHLHKLSSDGATLLDSGLVIHQNKDGYGMNQTGAEAYKLFKKDGLYYLWHNEIASDGKRRLCMMRSSCMYGKQADGTDGNFEHPGKYEHGQYFIWGYRGPNQGNLVQTPDGKDWYLVTHLDAAEIEGAPICVVPMKWENGWVMPITTPKGELGATMDDERLWRNIKKPLQGQAKTIPATSDEFSTPVLGLQWLWNHQPNNKYWSLTERPGFLRLYALSPLKYWVEENNLAIAGNTVYQRLVRNKQNTISCKLDISKIVNDQNAGLILSHYRDYSAIGVAQIGDKRFLRYYESEAFLSNKDKNIAICGNEIPSETKELFLKSVSDFNGNNQFYYSLNGKDYMAFGEKYQMRNSGHRGYYIGLFNYNNKKIEGYIDVDRFDYEMQSSR